MLWFVVSVLVGLGVLAGLYWWWKRQVDAEIAEGAEIEWAHFQKHEPEFLGGMSKEKFYEVYARVNMPRFPGYALAAFSTFFLSLPVTFIVLALGSWALQALGISPEPVELIRTVQLGEAKIPEPWECTSMCMQQIVEAYSGFYYFFGVMVVWLAIVAFFTRRFHSRRPGYLRDEIIRAREA